MKDSSGKEIDLLCPGGGGEAGVELRSCLAVVCASKNDCNPVSITVSGVSCL